MVFLGVHSRRLNGVHVTVGWRSHLVVDVRQSVFFAVLGVGDDVEIAFVQEVHIIQVLRVRDNLAYLLEFGAKV